jgi:ubiquinone/menaquinone biosynthesis C-methylase UbiE
VSAYGALARWYDALTADVPYDALAAYYEGLICRPGRETQPLLDLCCGTGTLALRMAARGHDMIGVDRSPEMLAIAAEKSARSQAAAQPLWLCQAAAALDLYGTVAGAYAALDSFNYLPPEDLPETLRRLHLFLEPGGRLAFDIQDPAALRARDGGTFVDETEDVLCLWRGEFDEAENALVYGMDIFSRSGRHWLRETEEHTEYAHAPAQLCALLEHSGFADVRVLTDGPMAAEGRIYLAATNLAH